MPSRFPPRTSGPVAFGVVVLATLVLGGIAGASMAMLHDTDSSDLLRMGGVSIGFMVVALATGVWWWRQIDEAAREAHKWAWWWGGSCGMGLAAAVILSLGFVHDVLPDALRSAPPEHLILGGGYFVLVCELVGYSVAWCVWWLRRL